MRTAVVMAFVFGAWQSWVQAQPQSSDPPFAETTHRAIDLVSRHYYREVPPEDLTAAAIRGLYAFADEKVPAEITERLANLKKSSSDERIAVLADARRRLGKWKELDELAACEAAIAEIVRSLEDPGCQYIPRSDWFICGMRADWFYNGISLDVELDVSADRLRVVTPIKDGPAYRAGVRAGDFITAIRREANEPREVTTFQGLTQEEIDWRLRGNRGSWVCLTIERKGVLQPIVTEMHVVPLKSISVETVLGFKRSANDDWIYRLPADPRIAYVRISYLGSETAEQFATVRDQLQRQGIKGLILDLRFNSGGLLSTFLHLVEHFLADGRVVSLQTRPLEDLQEYDVRKSMRNWNIPVVCMVNGETASSAEALAACLKDHGRGVVVGERSAGRATIQNVMEVNGAGLIKLTTAFFVRPNGRKLTRLPLPGRDADEWGVSPDPGHQLILPNREREVLRRFLNQQYWIHPAGRTIPEWERTFTDRQLGLAIAWLKERLPPR